MSLDVKLDTNMRLFRAQRNMYLAGMTLYTMIILYRLYKLIGENLRLARNAEVVKKQAENQVNEYQRLTREKEELEKKLDSKQILVQDDDGKDISVADFKKVQKELQEAKQKAIEV